MVKKILLMVLVLIGWRAQAQSAPSFPSVDAEPLGAVPKDALVLHAGWQLKDAAPDAAGGAVSQVGYAAQGWIETTVPTTVLGTLVRHGVYPDPYIGTNNLLIPDASEKHTKRLNLAQYSHLPGQENPWLKPWWFRTEFKVPADYAGRTVWVHLDGLNYRAELWVNGVRMASTNELVGMFRRFCLDVTKVVKPGRANGLAVRIQGLDYPGDPLSEPLDGLKGGIGVNGGDRSIFDNVAQACAIGWDWVRPARDRNMGLWQHVWLEAGGPVAVRDPAAFPDVKLPGGEEAAVTVRAFLESAGETERPVEVVARLAPDGFPGATVEARKRVVVKAGGGNEVTFSPKEFPALIIKQPRLWWPVTYGEQPLYRLTVEAWTDGKLSGTMSSQVGMRTVATTILPSGGRAWIVNGRIIRMTGGHVVPDFLLSWSAERYRTEVRMLAHANNTVVRVNGCGIMMPEAFFAECDRQGLLVWNDMARTSPPRDTPAEMVPIYLANMEDCIRRMRGHASMLVYCGCNEVLPSENIGRPLQDELLPRLDGTRPWIVSSGSDAKWARGKIATWSFGPYGTMPLARYFGFYRGGGGLACKNEIGVASPPTLNAVARFVPDLDKPDPATAPLNRTMGYHDAAGSHYRKLDGFLRDEIGATAPLAEYLAMADLFNSACYRAIFEAANAARPLNAGTHLWKVNAAWPSFQWQIYDWYLRPNAGYYSLRSACKPLHVQASMDDFNVQVASTLPSARPGLKVRITVVGAGGAIEAGETRAVDVPADATLNLGALPGIVTNGQMHFVALDLLDAQGAELDRTVVWLQKNQSWRDLLTLPPAVVKAEVLERTEREGETTYRIRVENASKIPAVQVWLDVLRGSQGEEVLPCFWNENAMTMLPGEKREVTVGFRTSLLGAAKPYLSLGGWNVTPREAPVEGGAPTPMSVAASGAGMKPGQVLTFTAEQVSAKGARYHTWAVPVWMDGKLFRYVRVGLRGGESATAECSFMPLAPGRHTFHVGEITGAGVIVEVPAPLWTIGQRDGDQGDLVFKAGSDHKTRSGAQFTVGVSDPAKDWPAVQPGPRDKWAGKQTHTNVVTFRVDAPLAVTGAYLVLKLMDSHPNSPPLLYVELNGCRRELQVRAGSSQESLHHPKPDTSFRQFVVFPNGTLKAGDNTLKITNHAGSWIVYDGLEMHPL
jgi:hypothetical protein